MALGGGEDRGAHQPDSFILLIYRIINSHKARQRPTRNQVLMSRSAIKYAVNIYQRLPNITGSVARPAKTLGDFGLVAGGFTTAYQLLPFAQIDLRSLAFTISSSAYMGTRLICNDNGLGHMIDCGEHPT